MGFVGQHHQNFMISGRPFDASLLSLGDWAHAVPIHNSPACCFDVAGVVRATRDARPTPRRDVVSWVQMLRFLRYTSVPWRIVNTQMRLHAKWAWQRACVLDDSNMRRSVDKHQWDLRSRVEDWYWCLHVAFSVRVSECV